jgi:hypothetical protein
VYAIGSQFVNFQSQQDFGRITGSKHMFLGLNDRAILSSSQYYSGSGDWGWVVWWRCFPPFALPKDCRNRNKRTEDFKSTHKPDRILSLRQLCSRERFPLLFQENIFAEEP